jgi:osomolarity two-component system sensor histidine kinase SLN1
MTLEIAYFSNQKANFISQNLSRYGSSNFTMRAYPAIAKGFGKPSAEINNASSMITTTNENNVSVAVGYARPHSTLVQWLLIVEQSHEEAWAPISKLRTIVLACVFGTIGLILIVVLPLAHFSVRPIRRLRDATEKSVAPPGYTPNGSIISERLDGTGNISGDEEGDLENRNSSQRSKKGIFVRLRNLGASSRWKSKIDRVEADRRRGFKIPGRVQDRKHFVTDELTELTSKSLFSMSALFLDITNHL